MIDLKKLTKWDAGKLFDYAILPKDTDEEAIRNGCREAKAYNCAAFYSSSPYWTPIVVEELGDTDVNIATGISFPFGSQPSALKDKKYDVVKQELVDFKNAAQGRMTKGILDVAFLTDDEIKAGCELIKEVGLDYAKSATGQFEGPTMEQVLIMKETIADSNVKLKVSGVKFPRPQNAWAFIMAGAELIGTRSAPEIIDSMDQMREIGLLPPYEG